MHFSIDTLGPLIGSGSRARVYECCVDGKTIALKVYDEKRFLRQELKAYKQIQNKGFSSAHFPHYHGLCEVSNNALSAIPAKPSLRRSARSQPYHIGLGIQRIDGVRLDKTIDNLSEVQLKRSEDDLLAIVQSFHRDMGICHGDIKAPNILAGHGAADFVLLDLSEAIMKADVPQSLWARACVQDVRDLREIFTTARAAKAAKLGLDIIQKFHLDPQIIEDATEERSRLSDATQLRLSSLLKTTCSAHTPLRTLVDGILSYITSPIPQLGLALAKSLRILGQCSAAHDLLGRLISKTSAPFLPHFEREMALTMQSLRSHGATAMQYFNSAIQGFTIQLGPDHIMTLTCWYESAMQHAQANDIERAKDILSNILSTVRSRNERSKKERRLLGLCSSRLRNLQQRDHPPCTAPSHILSDSRNLGNKRNSCDNNAGQSPLKRPRLSELLPFDGQG